MVKEAPEFPGGPKAMMEYLKTNMRYPQIAKENGIQGRVILQFVVDETGKTRDPRILRSIDPALDAEAIRLVEAMPLWTLRCRFRSNLTRKGKRLPKMVSFL